MAASFNADISRIAGAPRKSSYSDSLNDPHSRKGSIRSTSPAASLLSSNGNGIENSPSGQDLDQYGAEGGAKDQSFIPAANMEDLTLRLFSIDHLKLILQSPIYFPRFQNFLAQYRPHLALSLKRYLDVQKALSATKYANAVAESLWPGLVAAITDEEFERKLDTTFTQLINEALPGFVTHRMTQLVTEILVKEITGQAVPLMNNLVNGLAEVYCLTDPRIPDNPIIYASPQFFAATGYDNKAVIGKNCRFLQGAKTSKASVDRLVDALTEGVEICESILNYRKDGTPFVNLLLIAPLHDMDGKVRYFLGAQVDINGLIEEGRGLDSFAALLARDRRRSLAGGLAKGETPMGAIAEFGRYLNDHERSVIQSTAGETSNNAQGRPNGSSTATTRRAFGLNDPDDADLWSGPNLGPDGRMPGVFQNYLLVRPYPSLRVIYTAPSMRGVDLIDTRFLSWIRGPANVRQNIKYALSFGESFTAKVSWLCGPNASAIAAAEANAQTPGKESGRIAGTMAKESMRPLWLHCTPLVGEANRVGLWMVVLIKNEGMSGAMGDLSLAGS